MARKAMRDEFVRRSRTLKVASRAIRQAFSVSPMSSLCEPASRAETDFGVLRSLFALRTAVGFELEVRRPAERRLAGSEDMGALQMVLHHNPTRGRLHGREEL